MSYRSLLPLLVFSWVSHVIVLWQTDFPGVTLPRSAPPNGTPPPPPPTPQQQQPAAADSPASVIFRISVAVLRSRLSTLSAVAQLHKD